MGQLQPPYPTLILCISPLSVSQDEITIEQEIKVDHAGTVGESLGAAGIALHLFQYAEEWEGLKVGADLYCFA